MNRESENYWSIQGWIHSERRNRLDQKLVEKLIRSHTNLVMRESLDDTQRHLLPWDIEFVIDEVVDAHEVEKRRGRDSEEEGGGGRRGGEEFKCGTRTCARVWVDAGNNPSDSFFKHVSRCGYYVCLTDDCLSLFESFVLCVCCLLLIDKSRVKDTETYMYTCQVFIGRQVHLLISLL